MKFRVHHFEVSMTKDQMKLQQFLNSLQGKAVSFNPNITLGLTSLHGNVLLIVEKVI